MTTTRHHFTINNEHVPIIIRRHSTAKRIVLRYQPLHRHISLTIPRYVSLRQGLHFVKEKQQWLTQQIVSHSENIPLEDGALIPLLGQPYRVKHVGGRGVVTLSHDPLVASKLDDRLAGDQSVQPEEKQLQVPGDAQFIARRVQDWLRQFAKDVIHKRVQQKAAQLGVTVSKISLRDTSTHWGSCGQDGKLSFSWRLVLAPYEVLDYVVSHEVAHLKELNHSPAFWHHVAELCPQWERHRAWLAQYGNTLYRYG